MGGYVSHQEENHVQPGPVQGGIVVANPNIPSTPSKKRNRTYDSAVDDVDEINVTPRKKMKSTSEYIYKTLFLNGENSDITIDVLNREWKLHKIYLCQSPYFRSMFKGDWLEKEKNIISILTPDDLIDTKSLEIAFGSLYSYDVDVDNLKENLIPVLASSRMLQLDGLLQHCEELMMETISADSVCKYHEAAVRYNLSLVENKCFSWLERNLLLCRTPSLAKNVPEYLLKDLLLSPNLVVMQVEMDVYNFMKIWLYLQLNKDDFSLKDFSLKKLVSESQKYYHSQKILSPLPLLETEHGSKYTSIYKSLRIENMIGDIKSISLVQKDNIIPKQWLLPLYEKQWLRMLSVYTGEDNGPTDIDHDLFERNSCRCGRILESDSRYCWRWTGFSYGIDIIVTYNNRTRSLTVKRNTFSQPCNFAVCMQGQRSVILRFKAFTLDENDEEDLSKDTGIMQWNFHTDEEIPLLELEDNWQFPIYISARLQLAAVIQATPQATTPQLQDSVYAEINCLSKDSGHTVWRKVFPSVVPVTIAKCKVVSGYIVRISVCKDQQVFGLEITLPVTRMKKTSDCFLQWRDKKYGGAWGLNFLSEKDIKRFMKCCTLLPADQLSSPDTSMTKGSPDESSSKTRRKMQKFASDPSINYIGLKSKENLILNDSGGGVAGGGGGGGGGPAIRKTLNTKRSVSRGSLNGPQIPTGFDATEYEFLMKGGRAGSDYDLHGSVGAGINGGGGGGGSKSSCNGGSRSSSTSNLSAPCLYDDNQSSNNSESLFNARPASAVAMNRAIMTTRKAAWLLVKNILNHTKKGKLELAPNRRWKQYWVALKGVELLFYNADEKTVTTDDLDEPVFELDVDGCIVQAVPEHARLENVFSLSSKNGNAYYLQATSQTEVDNWIHCIHTAAATALARRKGLDDIIPMLKQEIQTLTDTLLTDEKLKKMAVLQLKVEKGAQTRQTMNEQIIAWSNSLELHHAEYFRLRCYLAAMEGISNPNPQELLSHISRSTKHVLSKIGIFSVTSFHSYVHTRNNTAPPSDEKPKPKIKPKPKNPGLKSKLINSLKTNEEVATTTKSSTKSVRSSSSKSRPKSRDGSGSESSSKSLRDNKKQQHVELKGRIGNLLHIQLPENKSTTIPYENNLKMLDVLERVCLKEGLDSADYFIMLMTEEENQRGFLDFTIPKEKTLVDSLKYSSIKLCRIFILEVNLTNPADYEHGPFGIAIRETSDRRILVTHVDEGSEARKMGIYTEDEIIQVNSQIVEGKNERNKKDIIDIFNTSSKVSLTLKSKRIDDPKKTLQTTENIINFLVCPPPPKSMQPDMSDDLISALIVPAPMEFDENKSSVSTSRSFEKNSEMKAEDIDEFLQQTEEVNMMTREMNAAVVLESNYNPSARPGIRLQRAILELVETEKTYVKNLKILLERYLIPLQEEDFLSKDEADLLVGNVREIYEFQTTFFERIKAIIRNERRFDLLNNAEEFQNVLYLIGELFLEYVDKFKLYSTFCSCHSRAVKLLELNTNKALKAFLLARNPKQQHTGTLESYLITPIQRILRYPLLMKTMMKMMRVGSDEYNCMKDALASVERVADYINEMQRISETYTPIFQEMCRNKLELETSDVGVDNLLHYGRVHWVNHNTEHVGKNGTIIINKKNPENLTVFIFKRVIILISDDPNLRKKQSLSVSFSSVSSSDIKFHTMIPVSRLTLRDHAWSENENDQVWEIVDTTHEKLNKEIVYKFVNRTAEEKKVFVNAIKEVNKLSKRLSSSHAHGGSRKQPHPPQTKPKSPNILTANDIGLTTTMSPRNGSFRKKASSSTTTEKSTRSSSSRKSTSPRPLSGLGSRLIGKTS